MARAGPCGAERSGIGASSRSAPAGRRHRRGRGRPVASRRVLLIGLTGGIGSGKSTVSALLAEKGAVVIDADAITRELQQPGTEVLAAMVERFGEQILRA